jgi:uncharacterized protein involved in type VI secretion and phage assembly
MPWRLYDSAVKGEEEARRGTTSMVTGTVVNNCDLINEGKVLVRIPSRNLEVAAQVASVGGGPERGIQYIPAADDQVLVGLVEDDPDASYIVSGLWSAADKPPVSNPMEASTKRVIKTGVQKGMGHTLEFDDLKQSIKIESSTKQQVTITPTKIELTNQAGTVSVLLDTVQQKVTIKGLMVTVEATGVLELKGGTVKLSGKMVEIKGDGPTMIGGKPVKIN